MKYIVKQKIFSLTDSFNIKDEYENNMFYVKKQLLSFGNKLRIFDLSGNELCYIEQKVFRFMPEYNIYIAGELTATVKKKFALFRNDFEITSPLGDMYKIEGNFWAHEFTILKGDIPVATISKKFFSLSDTYGVDIDDNEDQVTILALAIVIDMVCHDENDD